MCEKLIRISRLYRTTDKSKLAEVWGVDRASGGVFPRGSRVHSLIIPLWYGYGYVFMIVQPPIELSQNHFLLLCRVTALL